MLCFNVITLKKGNNANDNTDEIYTVYGSCVTTITTIRNWFKRFRIENFDLKDEGCSNRSPTRSPSNDEYFKAIFTENPQYNVQKIMDVINIFR